MFPLDKPGISLLENSLNAASLRQKVIANNIANVDTPKFKRSDVRFEEFLQKEMEGMKPLEGYRTDLRHFRIGLPSAEVPIQVVEDGSTAMNNNLNNVDIDSEMSLMAKNQLRYNTLIGQMNHELKNVRTAIGGR